MEQLELSIRNTARVHERLLDGWRRETQAQPEELESLKQALEPWDQSPEPIPFALIDMILSQKTPGRARLLADLRDLAEQGVESERWLEFARCFEEEKKRPLQDRLKDHLASA